MTYEPDVLPPGAEQPDLVEILRWRARNQPDRIAFTFLVDGEEREASLTYAQLDRRARAVAAALRARADPGARVLLVHAPGLDFVAAFLGCLYARVVAVPAYPPDPVRPDRSIARLCAIGAASDARLALTSAAILSLAHDSLSRKPALECIEWVASDGLANDDASVWQPEPIDPGDLAFLQFTSGSTAEPKGVMITHANLMHNSEMIRRCFENEPDTRMMSWLPLYHDMGLIGGTIQPVYVGYHSILMSPVSFLERPVRWLRAITRHRATLSMGPNFAYDLCVRKIGEAERETLDLRSWACACNGSEPIRVETLERFAAAFASCGFRAGAFYPCYGLAEGTLIATGGLRSELPRTLRVERAALARGEIAERDAADPGARDLIGCGGPLAQEVIVVDPETHTVCPSDRVGEIWISGRSVARGYWSRPDETSAVFGARLANGVGPYLRTGDLGCLRDGELFVTGRLKDLLIVRGENHYPEDLELTVQAAHAAVRPGCVAAFALERPDGEQVGIAAEVDSRREVDLDGLIETLRRAVAVAHGITLGAVGLLRARTIPKTSSGKLQRRACATAFENGALDLLAAWEAPAEPATKQTAPPPTPGASRPEPPTRDSETIAVWLQEQIARRLRIPAADVDARRPFGDLALDSLQTAEIVVDLEEWLDRELPDTVAWDHPTIELLSEHLAGGEPAAAPPVPASVAPVDRREPIAIIGMACRFPGAAGVEEYWQLLRGGVDAVSEVPPERWDAHALYDSDRTAPGKVNSRRGGFLQDVAGFDPGFFGISRREAVRIDPQQRLLLEATVEALDDAGQIRADLFGSQTGVFVGISGFDYAAVQLADIRRIDGYSVTGNAHCIAANRISFHFGLRGPSVAVDTACSSSLVALHQACESLRHGECEAAIVGGVNVMILPHLTVGFTKGGAMSPVGRCKAFDASADGIVRGEGVGVVVLKPLSRARADGDPVRALIRGSAINNDGYRSGITTPSPEAQREVLLRAYRAAGVAASQVGYVEAHGTGTPLGDVIEGGSLGAVVGAGRRPDRPCAIGSVKTNLGHLEAAAGMAGLIKVVLCLEHRSLVPSLHFDTPNPKIPFRKIGLSVQIDTVPWREVEGRRLAGVSSFGFGGTNAHAVLEEAPGSSAASRGDDGRPQIVPLSAHGPEALRGLVERWVGWLSSDPEPPSLGEIAFSASVRRTHYDHRLALIARSPAELRERLEDALTSDAVPAAALGTPGGRAPRLVFVFSGHGSQWFGMERDLLAEPAFRSKLEACDAALRRVAGWSLLERLAEPVTEGLFAAGGELTQPAICSVQLALAELLKSWGIVPEAVVGHSMGEISAATAAGALSLDQAFRVLIERNALLEETQKFDGTMALVGLSADGARSEIESYPGRLFVAGSNSPQLTLLAGYRREIERLVQSLKGRSIFASALRADGLAHCPLVESLSESLSVRLAGLEPSPAQAAFYSSVTGTRGDGRQLDAEYWGRNMRAPVQFATAMATLAADGHRLFVELSPHPVLTKAVSQCLQHAGVEGRSLPTLQRKGDAREHMLATLGALYACHRQVDWAGVQRRSRPVSLPSVPWQRRRFWFDAPSQGAQPPPPQSGLLGRRLDSPALANQRVWETLVSLERFPFLADHRVQGTTLLPAAAHLDLAAAAAAEIYGPGPKELFDVAIEKALVLSADAAFRVQVVLTPDFAGDASFGVFASRCEVGHVMAWTRLASGRIRRATAAEAEPEADARLAGARGRCARAVSVDDAYRDLRWAVEYGPAFRGLRELWCGTGEALGRIELPADLRGDGVHFTLHPAFLDACLHVAGAALPSRARSGEVAVLHLPTGLESLRFDAALGFDGWSHAALRSFDASDGGGCSLDLRVFDERGTPRLQLKGLRLRRIGPDASAPASADARSLRERLLELPEDRRAEELLDQLTRILSRALGSVPAEIDPGRQLADLGIDSLIAIEVKTRVEAELGIGVPVVSFLRSPTLQEFCAELLLHLETSAPSMGTDLEAEVDLDSGVRPVAAPTPDPTEPESILLTGATGYLGPHLLAELMNATGATVHCLVRAANEERGYTRIRGALEHYGLWSDAWRSRIEPVIGELGAPRLGLSAQRFEALAEGLDTIYHAAAWLNTVYPYELLKPANVDGTHDILRLATCGRSKQVHHISTIAVFPIGVEHDGATLFEEHTFETCGLAAGYCESKWVAERLAAEAAARGVPVAIYRPGFITGDSGTGRSNTDDLLCRLLKGCIELGAMPDVDTLQDMTPVDYASRAIVHLSLSRRPASGYYHIVNPKPLHWGKLREWIESRGYPIRPLPYDDWLGRVHADCLRNASNPLRPLLPALLRDQNELFVFRRWNCDRTLAGLATTPIRCPAVEELLEPYFRFFVACGFLRAPAARSIDRAP